MKKCKVTFTKCIQDSKDYGSDHEHMVSRVFFDLEIDGTSHPGLHSDVKQLVGSSYESGAIEVSRPTGYKGPFNYVAFRDEVERYYRSLVGSTGSGIRIAGGASNIRMRHNTFEMAKTVEFDVDDSSSGGW